MQTAADCRLRQIPNSCIMKLAISPTHSPLADCITARQNVHFQFSTKILNRGYNSSMRATRLSVTEFLIC